MRASSQAHVLVVDDDSFIRECVAEVLEGEGYTVVQARHGGLALEWLEERRRAGAPPPLVVLLDMRMPVVDGWAFAAAYKDWPPPRAPLVVMTAAADAAACAAQIGADGVLAKPFDVEALIDLVQAYAHRRV